MMTLQPVGVIPPDVELWGAGYLRTFLAGRPETYAQGVHISNRKPTTNRPRTVTIRRDGGSLIGVYDFPRLGVRVWSDDEDEGADLARLVMAALKVAPGNGPCVALLNLSGPSPIPEPGQFQKYITAELQMRCDPL